MNIPKKLKYTREHEWIRVEGENAFVGITDFAQSELGDIVYVEIESVGQNLAVDDVFGTVEAVKAVSELFMPVSGHVLALNDALEAAPETVNSDPYEGGWMIKIKIADPKELDDMLDAEAYAELIGA